MSPWIGPGPHDRDLDDQIVEFFGLEPRQHGHLGAALDLEHADRVGALDHAIDRRVLVLHGEIAGHPVMRLQELEGAPQAGQHAEAQHVDLEDAERIEIVLVPFDDGAILHGGVLDRHHLVEPAAGDDEAADMLGQMAGKPDQLARQRERAMPSRRIGRIEPDAPRLLRAHAVHRPAPERAGERPDRVLRQAEHLADVANGAAAAVADDGRGEAGALARVGLVDVLDHLLAPLVLEIDVDVGRLAPLGRDETLEQKIDLERVDVGDAEAIADHRIGRRAAPLAENLLLVAGEVHDVVDGEKERRIVELADEPQFLGRARGAPSRECRPDSAAVRRPAQRRRAPPAAWRSPCGSRPDIRCSSVPRARSGSARESAASAATASGYVAEQPRHLGRRLEMPLGIGFEPAAGAVDGDMLADAGEHVLQRRAASGSDRARR